MTKSHPTRSIEHAILMLWDGDRTRDKSEFAYLITDTRSDLRLSSSTAGNYQQVMDLIRFRDPEPPANNLQGVTRAS